MSRFACIIFALSFTATLVMAEEKTCSPWLGYCQVYENCCRDLECSSYQGKCVPILGLKIPGKDTRPIGPGPYPPKTQYRSGN